MKILLVGEYSGLHNTLKQGLLHHGHEVVLIGTGDGFKNYPVDYDHKSRFFSRPAFRPFVKLFERLTSINLIQFENGYRFKNILPMLKDFDVVQLINEQSIRTRPKTEIKLLKQLLAQNGSLFLLSCGTDYTSVKYAVDGHFRYSILTPYLNDPGIKANYRFILRYLTAPYKRLHNFLYDHISGVIASDLDYHIPLKNNPKYLGIVPNPINLKQLNYKSPKFKNGITIFHGVNTTNYVKKGNQFFDEALDIVKRKFGEQVIVIRSENKPYKEYIRAYDEAHILLDQVYAYDQGFNALEAMAKGKVVFTGAEKEWLDHYDLEPNTVAINALPDTSYLVEKLTWLIQNPDKISEISSNARAFMEKEHDHIKCAALYLKKWTNA